MKANPTNQLTIRNQRWMCGCIYPVADVMPHYCPVHNSPPVIEIIDEVSGIKNLTKTNTKTIKQIDNIVILAIGFACGALIMEAINLCLNY